MNTPILLDLNMDENIYLLGLLWADGNLYKTTIELSLTKKDFNYIIPIFKLFGYTKFETRQVLKDNLKFGKKTCRIRITNKLISNFLLSIDFNKKSNILPKKLLSIIPSNKKYLWWRGYIDGDGCFYCRGSTHNFSIWSTIQQDWTEFYDLCQFLNIENPILTKYRRKNGKHCSSKISLTRTNDIQKIGNYIYQTRLDLGLSRKYLKYKECISKPIPLFKAKISNKQGITYSRWFGTWQVRKTINKKRIWIGSYSNYKDACNAYDNYKSMMTPI